MLFSLKDIFICGVYEKLFFVPSPSMTPPAGFVVSAQSGPFYVRPVDDAEALQAATSYREAAGLPPLVQRERAGAGGGAGGAGPAPQQGRGAGGRFAGGAAAGASRRGRNCQRAARRVAGVAFVPGKNYRDYDAQDNDDRAGLPDFWPRHVKFTSQSLGCVRLLCPSQRSA